MQLSYSNKKDTKEILCRGNARRFQNKISNTTDSDNMLICGENTKALYSLIQSYGLKGKIDLVYIDPPFATNNIFKIGIDRANTISSSFDDEVAYHDLLKGSEYIEFIRERLILLHQLLSPRGSIYFHIDYKIGHYVKIIMDEVFGLNNFRNDITRVKCNPKNFSRKSYGNVKDLILFYTKSESFIWNDPRSQIPAEDIERLFRKTDSSGRKYTTVPLHAPGETSDGPTGKPWNNIPPPKGRHWRCAPTELDKLEKLGLIEWSKNGVPRKIIYADDALSRGKLVQDIWEFKDPQHPNYPTEKNIEMLKLIIKTSSEVGSYVLDCFSGSGTTLVAAQELGRRWIGIDQSKKAIEVCKKRLDRVEPTLFQKPPKYSFVKM